MNASLLRRIFSTLKLCVALYLALILYVAIFQRNFIYSPAAEGTRLPTDYGVPFENIHIPTSNGEERVGWYVHRSNMKRPTLVYCQGNGGALSERAKVTALFDSVGVDVVMLSYRGYGGSGYGKLKPSEAQVYEDAQAAYDFARSHVPENQIIIWGHSLGAAVAAHLGATNHPAAVMLESPFTSVSAMAPVKFPWLLIPDFLIVDKLPTIEFVKRIKVPLMVMVAQKDTIIPPHFGAEVFAAANEPKAFLPLEGIGHNDLPENFETFRAPIQEFIRKYVS